MYSTMPSQEEVLTIDELLSILLNKGDNLKGLELSFLNIKVQDLKDYISFKKTMRTNGFAFAFYSDGVYVGEVSDNDKDLKEIVKGHLRRKIALKENVYTIKGISDKFWIRVLGPLLRQALLSNLKRKIGSKKSCIIKTMRNGVARVFFDIDTFRKSFTREETEYVLVGIEFFRIIRINEYNFGVCYRLTYDTFSWGEIIEEKTRRISLISRVSSKINEVQYENYVKKLMKHIGKLSFTLSNKKFLLHMR